ncbi:acyltransferase family protein [Aliiglaciecola sp. 2_MG-2023]|uniref:acyltransferase family protein n=1 Tax=unclassified Aliiglaciecola TaxID=2593648 RepID=UPI0026E1BABC|nr:MULTISPECIES: acyltransferase family protein [unclassified Aliiglaciecola]MDO6712872.1 acyltransferase family protein [Aliiglaciecola sp. 2_MG-2023]MDO6752892.1 acyltransferase family protein [Aliiglaciecola sp. 1_MG-2023]
MSTLTTEVHKKKRIEFIDALKGFAILTVLWGHSIQYLKNSYDFFHNAAFEFIYSFHMPLFFLISGFFFHATLKINLKKFFVKKSMQLLLPCFNWALVFVLIWYAAEITRGKEHGLNEILLEIWERTYDVWFLRELFISYFIVFVSLKVLKKEWLAFVISISFVLFFPYLLEKQRVLLLIFWAGFFFKNNYQFFSSHAKTILLISAVLFATCLLDWDGSYTMYVSRFPSLFDFKELKFNFTNIDISIFRLFIGLCGSIFFFILFEIIYSRNVFFNWLSKIGAHTLSIYLLQRLILEGMLDKIIDFPNMKIWVYNLIVTPLISLVVLGLCLIIVQITQRIKYADLLLFGKTST